jgi:hypothetical protein
VSLPCVSDRYFLRFKSADLYVIKGQHEVGGDLSRFIFAYDLRDILLIGLENVT